MPFTEEKLKERAAKLGDIKVEDDWIYIYWGDDDGWVKIGPASGGFVTGVDVGAAMGDETSDLLDAVRRSAREMLDQTPRMPIPAATSITAGHIPVTPGFDPYAVSGVDDSAIYTKSRPPKPVMNAVTAALFREVSIAVRFFKSLETVEAAIQADRLEGALADLRAEFHFPTDLTEKACATFSGKLPENGPRGHGDSSDIITWDPNKDYKPQIGGGRKVRRR